MRTSSGPPPRRRSRGDKQRVPLAAVGGVLMVLAAALLFASLWQRQRAAVLLPVLVASLAAGGYLYWSWRRSGTVVTLGCVFVSAAFLYAVVPPAGFVFQGLEFPSAAASFRLVRAGPSVSDVAEVSWRYSLFLMVFALASLAFQGRAKEPLRLDRTTSPQLWVAVAALAAVQLGVMLVDLRYGVSEATYLESYSRTTRIPLLLRQIYNHGAGAIHTLAVLVGIAVCVRHRWLSWALAALVVAHGVVATLRLHGRSETILLALSLVVVYHHCVRRITLRAALSIAAVLIAWFAAVGLMRATGDITWERVASRTTSNEFTSVFGTAVDLREWRVRYPSARAPESLLYSDLLAPVPQQLLPFSKSSPANWYVQTLYPELAESGKGYAFGVVAETYLWFGYTGLLVRATLIAAVLAFVERQWGKGTQSVYGFTTYVWMLSHSYLSIRHSTFAFLAPMIYQLVATLAAMRLLELGLRFGRRTRRGSERCAEVLAVPVEPPPGADTSLGGAGGNGGRGRRGATGRGLPN